MRKRTKWCVAVAALAILVSTPAAWAADPAQTTLTIPDLHCNGCAKKVATKLYQVPGVAAVYANMEAKTITVSPQAQQVLSPRALWEAAEKAAKHPSRLEGPGGTFTAKPQS